MVLIPVRRRNGRDEAAIGRLSETAALAGIVSRRDFSAPGSVTGMSYMLAFNMNKRPDSMNICIELRGAARRHGHDADAPVARPSPSGHGVSVAAVSP